MKSLAKVHFSVKREKQEMSVNELKLFIAVLYLDYGIYIMWESGNLNCD